MIFYPKSQVRTVLLEKGIDLGKQLTYALLAIFF